jgi:hypothetical protein
MTEAPGVAGNARITGVAGVVIFVLLAAEGVTILRVHELLAAHIFIGMVLVPIALVKTATTSYRIVRYYAGNASYVEKGPPPIILRVLGPLVIVLTLAVLATGIAVGIAGPPAHRLVELHKAVFIVWFAVMTVHVLGHAIETVHLARADWSPATRSTVPGASVRTLTIVVALVAGIALGWATYHWSGEWPHPEGRSHSAAPR